MYKPFYNTVGLTGDDLKQAVEKAQRQEEAVYLIYLHTGKAYGPSQILRLVQKAGKSWPITSLRRAITNLEKEGKLVKTDLMREGMFGSPEHLWTIKKIA